MLASNRGRNVKFWVIILSSTRTSQLPIFSTQLWRVQLTEITCWNSHAPLRPDWPSLGQKCVFYYCTGNVSNRALRHTQPCRTSGPVWPNNVSGEQSSECDSLPTNGAIYYSLRYSRRSAIGQRYLSSATYFNCNIHGVPKKVVHRQFLTDFRNSFTAGKRSKFPTQLVQYFHHTFSTLPHYLAKVRSSKFGMIWGRKCKRKCNIHWSLNSQPILMH